MTVVVALAGAVLASYALGVLLMLLRGMPQEPPAWYAVARIRKILAATADQFTLAWYLPLALPLTSYRRSVTARLAIPFGTHGLRLDAFATPLRTEKSVVIFLYGGAWGSGNRSIYGLLARTLVAEGHPLVIPDYRLHPHARVDGMLDDVRDALAWTASHRGELGSEAEQVVIVGHSAGAHLGALLLTRAFVANDRTLLDRMRAFVGMSGIYDIADHYRHEHARGVESVSPMGRVMGETAAGFKNASPGLEVARVSDASSVPPITLLHGRCDRTVPFSSSEGFARTLARARWPAALIPLDGAGHIDLVLDLMRPGVWTPQLIDALRSNV